MPVDIEVDQNQLWQGWFEPVAQEGLNQQQFGQCTAYTLPY
jgi:hypothetical protein